MPGDDTPNRPVSRGDPRSEVTPVVRVKTIYIVLDRDIAREKDMVMSYLMQENWLSGMIPVALNVSLAEAQKAGVDELTWRKDMAEMMRVKREFQSRKSPVAEPPRIEADTGDVESYTRYTIRTDRDQQPSTVFAEEAPSLMPALHKANAQSVSQQALHEMVNWRMDTKIVLGHYRLWGLNTESATELSKYSEDDYQRDMGGGGLGSASVSIAVDEEAPHEEPGDASSGEDTRKFFQPDSSGSDGDDDQATPAEYTPEDGDAPGGE